METHLELTVQSRNRIEIALRLMRFAQEMLIDGRDEDHERPTEEGSSYGCGGQISWRFTEGH